MATLGNQTIQSSYTQLLKFTDAGGVAGTLGTVEDGAGKDTALSISSSEIKTTGSLTVSEISTLTGAVTFGTSLTASNGTATIGTASISTASISTATIPQITLSTATISTATISTATISTMLGAVTFGSTITASTGTNTLGTIATNYATIGTLDTLNGINVTTTATIGTTQFGASGPRLTQVSYGTAAFSASTIEPYNSASTSVGTFTLTGVALGDIVIGSINSLGSLAGGDGVQLSMYPISSNTVRYCLGNDGSTHSTAPAGTIFASAWRFTS